MSRTHQIRVTPLETVAAPKYELRIRTHGIDDSEWEVWQVPSAATPHIKTPIRIASLRARNLTLVEHRLLRQLGRDGIDLAKRRDLAGQAYPLSENLALMLGLLFRVLAPMRNRDNMRACAAGIEEMSREEAGYWLGMAMHRKNPRRVLMALRILLTDPVN